MFVLTLSNAHISVSLSQGIEEMILPNTADWIVFPDAVVRKCSVKKVFLEIWQNSQENTCARGSFFKKLQT